MDIDVIVPTGRSGCARTGGLQSVYDSVWHHPLSFWILELGFLIVVLVRPPRERRAVAILIGGTLLTALDAGLTANTSPVPSAWQGSVGLVFVILGDWRYWLHARLDPARRTLRAAAAQGLGLALAVPLAMLIPRAQGLAGRPLFLLYESCAFGLALVMWLVTRRHGWLTAFWLAMYGGWITADLLILAGLDVGYGVRLLPNTLYYGLFWPVVYLGLRRGLVAYSRPT